MNPHERVPIVRKQGITIYGRVIDTKGKLGRYEVMSDYWGHDGKVYATFADAEARFDYLKGLTDKKEREK